MDRRRLLKLTSIALAGAYALPEAAHAQAAQTAPGLWNVWDSAIARARFVSLSQREAVERSGSPGRREPTG